MEIKIVSKNNLEEMLNLCKNFKTSPFTFDKEYILLSPDKEIYPEMAKRLINSPYSISIGVYNDNNLIAFITVSVNPKLSNMVGKKLGNILLLVVDPAFQNKGLGKQLVKKGLELLESMGVELITVSTDIYNTKAIRVYESNGFKFHMAWHIMRNYITSPSTSIEHSKLIVPLKNIKTLSKFYHNLERPFPLLYENSLNRDYVKSYIFENLIRQITNGEVMALGFKSNKKNQVILTYQYDIISQNTLNTNKKVLKILDIMFSPELSEKEKEETIHILLDDLKKRNLDACLIEMWVRAENQDMIKILQKDGFLLAYTGIYLHYKK